MLALAGASQMPIASEMVALELQNLLLASPLFRNASGNGKNDWKNCPCMLASMLSATATSVRAS
jgi:hypothetical protein